MFERFTAAARQVVVVAQEESRALRHGHIGTEHLLLALLRGGGAAAAALTEAGVTPGSARAEISRLVAARSTDDRDADALRAIGIDLDTVRAKVEQSFGAGALERARGRRSRLRRPRAGHVPFTPRAKKVLELSLREALRLQHDWIGAEHILLGLLREGDGLAMTVLTVHGVSADTLRRRVVAVIGAAA